MTRKTSALAMGLAFACAAGCDGSNSPGFSNSALPAASEPKVMQAADMTAPDCTVAFWGDSIMFGGYALGASRLSEPPVVALKRMRPEWTVIDRSVNGASATYFSPEFLRDRLSERVQVLQYGQNDQGLALPYESHMRAMIGHAVSKQRLVVVTGLAQIENDAPNHPVYNQIAKRLADEYKVSFADWNTVEFHPGDTFDDTLPRQGYSERLVARLAATLDDVAPDCAGD